MVPAGSRPTHRRHSPTHPRSTPLLSPPRVLRFPVSLLRHAVFAASCWNVSTPDACVAICVHVRCFHNDSQRYAMRAFMSCSVRAFVYLVLLRGGRGRIYVYVCARFCAFQYVSVCQYMCVKLSIGVCVYVVFMCPFVSSICVCLSVCMRL